MAGSRFVANYDGIGQLRKSDEIRADLEERGARVRDAAVARNVLVQWKDEPRIPIPVEMETHDEGTRLVVRVGLMHPAGLPAEAKYHILTGAMDAAR